MKKVHDFLNESIQDSHVIGMGSGSTIEAYIPSMADYIKEKNLSVEFVPTSLKTEKALKNHSLELNFQPTKIDFTIDGADYFKTDCNVIKGGGGSLLREKQIGYFSEYITIVAKSHKMVSNFNGIPVPIEINPFLREMTKEHISQVINSSNIEDRLAGQELFVTDNGNHIVDCLLNDYDEINNLQNELLNIPGVVETGIFNRNIKRIVTFDESDFTIFER